MTETMMEKNDIVNHPSHYTDGKYEVIDFIEFWGLGFHLGNAVKYISRAGKKDPSKKLEDLAKANWYIHRALTYPSDCRMAPASAYYIREGKKTINVLAYCEDKGITDNDLRICLENIVYTPMLDDSLQSAIDHLGAYMITLTAMEELKGEAE